MYAYDYAAIKCENANARGDVQCWNHVQVKVELARQRVIAWLVAEGTKIPGFREVLVDFA